MNRGYLVLIFFLGIVIPLSLQAASQAQDLFQSALVAENGERDLDKAVGLYKQVLKEARDDRPLTARALLHLGICYEQLGKAREALLVYRSIVTEPSDVPADILRQARSNQERLNSRIASALNPADTKKVVAGGSQSAAVQNDGSVLWWGSNPVLGKTFRPLPLEGFVNAVGFAWGSSHWVVLNQDGSVSAGGDNTHGQLGDGTTLSRLQPALVNALTGVTTVATGDAHSLAVKNDGTVWTWGLNDHGQLGNKTFTDRTQPVPTYNLSDVVALAAGREHSVALKGNGSVWCWGHNNLGQLGVNPSFLVLPYPKEVPGLTDIVSIAAGKNHTVALQNDGAVWTWGDNSAGQLGNGSTAWSAVPTRVPELNHVQAIAAGPTYTLALKSDGTVWAWGDNKAGSLGTGDTISRASPAPVANLTNVQWISAGGGHNLAIKKDGTVWAWGRNDTGQIGDGSTQNRLSPVRISAAVPSSSN